MTAAVGCPGKKETAPPPPWSVSLLEADGASWCGANGDGCAPAGKGAHAAAGAYLRTADPGSAKVTLDDETVAELGPNAAIALADGNPRVVDVKGGVVVLRRAPSGAKHTPIAVRVGGQLADLDPRVPTVVAARAQGEGRGAVSVEHGVVAFHGAELRAGDTAQIAKDQPVDRRAMFAGTVAPVEAPIREDHAHGGPRGLGTMTARVPGTEEVVAGVHLASHKVRAIVQHGFARTEVEELFANDSDRVVEGRYVFPVPPRAVTARLALYVDDKLVEDEIVEKKRAAAIFKDIVDDTVRPRDPALLEWVASGELSLKVFPIPAKGSRRVVVAYDEALATIGDEARYVYPLSFGEARANAIDDLSIEVSASDPEGAPLDVETPHYAAAITHDGKSVTAKFGAKSFTPAADFVLSWRVPHPVAADAAAFVPAWGAPEGLALDRTVKAAGTQSFGAVRVAIGLSGGAQPPAFKKRDRVIVIDTSQSQSKETLDAEKDLALAIAASLEPDERFALLACDSACRSFPDKGLVPASSQKLADAEAWARGLVAAGSSDLAGALLDAASRTDDGAGAQIVYVGDGVATSGELAPLKIAQRVKPAVDKKKGDVRFIGAGATVDAATLGVIARELGATYQPLTTGEPLARRAARLCAQLRMPVVRSPKIKLPETMSDIYPSQLPNLVLGDQVLIVGKLAQTTDATLEISGDLDGAAWTSTYALAWGAAPDHQAAVVPRLWAAHRIEDLIAMHDPKADKESIELSKRFHVLSRLTSMLVLENDAMFAAYGIQRTTGGAKPAAGGGVSPAQAASLSQQAADMQIAMLGALNGSGPAVSMSDLKSASSGASNNGLGGLGSPNGGSTAGSLSSPTRRANVSSSAASSNPPVPGADRIIAMNRARVRACYQQGLNADPSLTGAVVVTIRVAPNGEVVNVGTSPSGSISPNVLACISRVLRNANFDAPGGGGATVIARYMLTSTEAPPPSPPMGFDYPRSYQPPPGPTAYTRASDDTWRTSGDDAIAKLQATSDASPTSRMKREALIRGLLVRGRFEPALALARAFVEADPDLPAARELLSYAAAASGDAQAALLAVDAAVETNATQSKSHLRAARAFEAAGDERRACAHWRSLAELEASDEWRYQSLRCRARALGDREAALAEARAIEKPGPLVAKLLPALDGAGELPAYDPQTSSQGQMEVSITCAQGTTTCPTPIVVAPNGTVFSPMTPADARSSATAVAVTVLRDGTYHVLIVGGSDDAKGEIVVRAAGATQKFPFARGGAAQSIAVSDVTVPPPWLGVLGPGLLQFSW